MRHRLLLLLASPLLLPFGGCNPEPNPGPRIDLVGSTSPPLLSASRSSTVPADTFTTRVFAESRDTVSGTPLARLRITVDYVRNRNPYAYPNPYDPDRVPTEQAPLVYLDSLLPADTRAKVFQYTAGTRSTSGKETWTFQVEDTEGASNKRSYVLTLRNPDSLLTYHRYTLRLQAPLTRKSRSYLALSAGLALPAFALGPATAENRDSIDVVYLPLAAGARALAAPADPALTLRSWTTRRRTEFRRTPLDLAGFMAADSQAELVAAFTNGVSPATNTGVLVRGQVIAFRTASKKTGLLYIDDFPTAPRPAVQLQVRITK